MNWVVEGSGKMGPVSARARTPKRTQSEHECVAEKVASPH